MLSQILIIGKGKILIKYKKIFKRRIINNLTLFTLYDRGKTNN
jgi:hypothetical protein